MPRRDVSVFITEFYTTGIRTNAHHVFAAVTSRRPGVRGHRDSLKELRFDRRGRVWRFAFGFDPKRKAIVLWQQIRRQEEVFIATFSARLMLALLRTLPV